MRQRLFDIDILAGRTGGDHHGHVLMVGRSDQDGVDILPVQDLPILLGGECLRIGELLARSQMGVPNVTDSRHAHPRDPRQCFHQALAAAAGSDAADIYGFVGGVAAGSGEIPTESRVP